jgi:predicted HTH transcriptional regulator
MQTEYKTLSQKSQLLIKKSEGYDVDFKMNVKGLESEDLVAFANSEGGGTILLGVDEIETSNGQRGKVCGCDISDNSKLSIINKAEYCAPPIEIKIFTENLSSKPIFRIEIPSSNLKPHCTQKGIYKIRGDGRNVPLLPNDLLVLGTKIQTLTQNMNSVWGSAEEAGGMSLDVLENQSYISEQIKTFTDELNWNNDVNNYKTEIRLKTILEHLQLEDPGEISSLDMYEQIMSKRRKQ